MSSPNNKKQKLAANETTMSEECDFLVVGGGATGMAFVDTLLAHYPTEDVSVIMVDKHQHPGGQWNDSYSFVRLHQPSNGYGVETLPLEPEEERIHQDSIPPEKLHRATREDILDYYQTVRETLKEKHQFQFLGNTVFDFSQMTTAGSNSEPKSEEGTIYKLYKTQKGNINGDTNATELLIRVKQRVVDARFLEPDLPIFVPPKFSYNSTAIQVVPVNALVVTSSSGNGENNKATTTQYYVVIGGGKTGMDAIYYLLTQLNINPSNIMWVVPNDVWITAREKIGSCMEFLHTCTQLFKQQQSSSDAPEKGAMIQSPDLFQKAFLEWERQGKIYRLYPNDKDAYPTKFKDATLCQEEMAIIRKVQNVVRKHGRVQSIDDTGKMHFVDGTAVALPWKGATEKDTTFVHCSAGAFNYTKQANAETQQRPPVFGEKLITIQDVYGTPGFCFVGSLIGKLTCMTSLTDAERNAMCLAPDPTDSSQINLPLGPSGGDVGGLSSDHGYVQRLCNLKKWTTNETIGPEMKRWLVGHRLFNLGHLKETEMMTLVEETWQILSENGIVEP